MHKRIQEIDLLRGMSALAVVLIHTSAVYLRMAQENTLQFILVSGLNSYSKFAVQLFVFISGFLLFYLYKDNEYSLREFYVKRIKHVLIPYFFWTAVFIAVSGKMSIMPFGQFLWYYLEMLLTSKAAYHTYFILLIIQFYLMFPLFQKLLKRFNFSKAFLIWSGLIYLLVLTLDYYAVDLTKLVLPREVVAYRTKFFILWYFYFILGAYAAYYFKEFKELIIKLNKQWVLMMLFILCLITGEYIASVEYFDFDMGYAATPLKPSIFIYTLFSIAALYWLAIKIMQGSSPVKKFMFLVSDYSLTIYFAHPLILKHTFALRVFPWPVGNLLLTYLLTVLLTILLTWVLARSKSTSTLVGAVFVDRNLLNLADKKTFSK